MTTLELHGVHKSYGNVAALKGIQLSVPRGSRTAIVGPSGSGKTSLLRIIAGFEAPDAGRVVLQGDVLADGPAIVPAHQRGIGYVPQDGALFPHLSVADNVGFGLDKSAPDRKARINELMDMVSLDRAMLQRRPHELSGGQQQRVALARALAQRPKLMLLDEPFSALDTGLRASTRKAVARLLQDAGITTILVTHDQAEALSFADQVAVMRGGLLAQVGMPLDLYLRPNDPVTASFLGDAVVLDATLSAGWADCALGRLPTQDHARVGSGQILLRPEQLSVSPLDTAAVSAGEAPSCVGTVVETDFCGSVCELIVQLDTSANGARVHVHSAGLEAPGVGARVQVSARGMAHVFPAS
ncbi:ABC transporter ATP-binding protein [Rhodoferax mekongensis]|uniref:ABC transporter ATP-binding protein n=1 Tax=Rhodoferax mekongensis TaxID=3068341 RepID=A0ABZ0B174_9BURK|nr:ABC transporter ATP-binding protein [Rhodoferax sp. TBRC 17307]WNO04774.1 ABC transporter ATP-binding protein [Rhodoferax sp. TBRC 17307]